MPAWGDSMPKSIAVAAIAMAMMVLGGDPQSALHCVIVIISFSVLRAIAAVLVKPNPKRRVVSRVRLIDSPAAKSIFVCVAASLLALGLTAVQVAASIDWSRHSERVSGVGRATEVYSFSLAPWHLLELFTPRPFGHPFPLNQRLAKLIPGDGRMWTPSIYAGLVVGFALLCRLVTPRRGWKDPWFMMAVACLVLCFGHFGFVWFLQQIPGWFDGVDSAIGGPYWCLCQVVPGYDSFRYPVKWLPFFAIASSMVAAQWVTENPERSERLLAAALGGLFLTGAAITHWVGADLIGGVAPGIGPFSVDEYWGPLDVAGAFRLIRNSCIYSLLFLLGMMWLRKQSRLAAGNRWSRRLTPAWMILISFDAGMNASALLPVVDVQTELKLAHQASPSRIAHARTLRTQAGAWPQCWMHSGSPDRASEVAASERIAWFGRWHLAERQAVFNSMVSIRSGAYADFWAAASREVKSLDREDRQRFWRAARQWLGLNAVSHVDGQRSLAAGGLSLVHVERKIVGSANHIRVVTRWRPEAAMADIVAEMRRSGKIPVPHVRVPSPKPLADGAVDLSPDQMGETIAGENTAGELIVRCKSECLVERCVLQDGNWLALIGGLDERGASELTTEVAVLRSSHLNQAVRVPAGDWRIRFVYRPWWRWPSVVGMGIALLITAILLILPNRPVPQSVRGIVSFFKPR